MNIVLLSSAGRCGIREYSRILMEGFCELGHRVHYIGVTRHDNRDLARRIRQVKHDDELVVFEYEPAIFWLGGLVRAMAWLRLWRRKRVLLSVHEIGPDKYAEARQIQWHLARPLLYETDWPHHVERRMAPARAERLDLINDPAKSVLA